MDEDEYVEAIAKIIGTTNRATPQVFALLEMALKEFPLSPELWTIRGNMIQLADESPFTLRDALESYEHATRLNPAYGEAYESIGYYFDVIEENFPKAEAAFQKAIGLGEGASSYRGLARVLAQMGRTAEALEVLATCPDKDLAEMRELEEEINGGIWSPG